MPWAATSFQVGPKAKPSGVVQHQHAPAHTTRGLQEGSGTWIKACDPWECWFFWQQKTVGTGCRRLATSAGLAPPKVTSQVPTVTSQDHGHQRGGR